MLSAVSQGPSMLPPQNDKNVIVNLVLHCKYCHPLSGCILSCYKGKKKSEIRFLLNQLSETSFQRILSYHESCPYRDRLAI